MTVKSMVSARLASLTAKHRAVDLQILREQKRPIPNHLRLQQLKKRRLAVKDNLHALAQQA
ncbi:MAG: YdcH family protein [Pseudomonadota bacterium]